MIQSFWKVFLATSIRWHIKTPIRFTIAFMALFIGSLLGNIILDLNARTSASFSSAMSASMESYGTEIRFPKPISIEQFNSLWKDEELLFFSFVPFHETSFVVEGKRFPLSITFCEKNECLDSILAPTSWKNLIPEDAKISLYGKNFSILFHDSPISLAQLDISSLPNLGITSLYSQQNLSPKELESLLKKFPGSKIFSSQERKSDSESITNAFRMNLFALAMIALLVSGYLVFASLDISLESRNQLFYKLLSLGTNPTMLGLAIGFEGFLLGFISGILAWLVGNFLSNYGWYYLASILPDVFGMIPANYDSFLSSWVIIPISITVACLSSYLAYSNKNIQESFKSRIQEKITPLKISIQSIIIPMGFLIGFTYLLFHEKKPIYGHVAVLILFYLQTKLSFISIQMIPKFFSSSIEWKLASRFISSYSTRFIAPISALSVAIALCISMTVLISSFRYTLIQWLNTNIRADSYFSIHEYIDKAKIQSFLQSVERYFPNQIIALYTDEWEVSSLTHTGIADIMAQDFNRLSLLNPPDIIQGKLTGVLASETAMLKWNLNIGDRITFPNLQFSGVIGGFYRNYTSRRGAFLINTQDKELSQFIDQMNIAGIAIHLKNKSSEELAELENFLLTYQDIGLHKSSIQLRESALQLFEKTFGITYVLQIITFLLASFSIAFALSSLILSRKRIFAIIASFLNKDKKPLQRILMKEAFMVILAATLIAIPSAFYLSWILVEGINRFSFGWSLSWKIPWDYLLMIYGGSIFSGIFTSYYLGLRLPILQIWNELKAKE